MEFIDFIIYISICIGLVATTFYILSFIEDKKIKRKNFLDKELPAISVIIPAYNEEESIVKTIESILASDYPKNKFEVIVIDDGSKDNTLEIAKRFENKQVKVFSKENGGKATALNFGISKAKGEIIFTMDADTFVNPESMKNMVHYFNNPRVMAVTPTMLVHKPKTILQRVQNMEYLLGIFLRKAFATLNAVYITPGAFSAYRKEFFDKYGGYDETNVTEDIEMSLRIQYQGYFIDNSPNAPAYTIAPSKFKELLIQRRRWYFGYIKNISKYRGLLSKKYGDLGLFIIPVGLLSTFFAVFMIIYLFFQTLIRINEELFFLQSINYDFYSVLNFDYYFFERMLFLIFTNSIFLFILLFMFVMGFYLYWTRKRVGKLEGLIIDINLFFLFFALLYGFWWTVSLIYALFTKTVKWK